MTEAHLLLYTLVRLAYYIHQGKETNMWVVDHQNEGPVTQHVALLIQISMLPESILCLGYCLNVVLCMASPWYSSFLLPLKNMPVSELIK